MSSCAIGSVLGNGGAGCPFGCGPAETTAWYACESALLRRCVSLTASADCFWTLTVAAVSNAVCVRGVAMIFGWLGAVIAFASFMSNTRKGKSAAVATAID